MRELPAAATLTVRGVTLEHQVEEYLLRLWEPTLDGIDTARLAALAEGYLQQAGEGSES